MATLEPTSWIESEDWRDQVLPSHHETFLKALGDADREGKEVYSVMIAGGVPLLYSIRDKTS